MPFHSAIVVGTAGSAAPSLQVGAYSTMRRWPSGIRSTVDKAGARTLATFGGRSGREHVDARIPRDGNAGVAQAEGALEASAHEVRGGGEHGDAARGPAVQVREHGLQQPRKHGGARGLG